MACKKNQKSKQVCIKNEEAKKIAEEQLEKVSGGVICGEETPATVVPDTNLKNDLTEALENLDGVGSYGSKDKR